MSKIAVRTHAGIKYVWYYCPGCKHNHGVPAELWQWNGDEESPTLSTSVRHYLLTPDEPTGKTICHYYVRRGCIGYCGDCEHELRGKTVKMVEPLNVPEDS